MMKKLKKLTSYQLFLPLVCVLLVLAVNVIFDISQGNNPFNFFSVSMTNGMLQGRLITILNRGSEVAILAIGMTLVVSASAGTDISVGSVMSLCASFCCMLIAGFGVSSVSSEDEFAMPMIVGLLGALLMGCLCGAFNGALVAFLNIQPMVATLILWSAARAIGLLLCNNLIVYIRVPEYGILGGYVGPTPILIASSVIGGTLLTGGVGNVIGTLFGVMVLASIQKIIALSPLNDSWWQEMANGAMLGLFLIIQKVVLAKREKKK